MAKQTVPSETYTTEASASRAQAQADVAVPDPATIEEGMAAIEANRRCNRHPNESLPCSICG